MNPPRPIAYDQLSVEAAARIDAVCDAFEKAWKAARSGAAVPSLASFLDGCEGPERTVLAGELLALEQACRQRYGQTLRPGGCSDQGASQGDASATAATGSLHRSEIPTGRPIGAPSIAGLELLEILGSGGMGVVFKARQPALDREVAVKLLREAHREDLGQRERFVQEARAIARLRHPHLVQVCDFGEAATAGSVTTQPYLVLEYVSGGTLAELVRGSPQPPAEAARLIASLADAIHYAHQQGVIHRDLKPANVLLQRLTAETAGDTEKTQRKSDDRTAGLGCSSAFSAVKLVPKITDFGLAKLLAGGDLTQSGELLGTPSYMAPEQAAGKAVPITAAVDVYGLGTILYETLTGHPPFAAPTVEVTLGLVRQAEPVPPRRLQPTVPRDLETICLKCLRKEASRRYATAGDLADDLRRFGAGEPIHARPVGMGERVISWCCRKPAVAGLLAALVLIFLTGGSGVLWQWQRARQSAALAERNAIDFRHERDLARQQKERAERHLEMVRARVDRLNRLGRELLVRPGLYRTGQAVLEEALAFYQELLPEEGHDPRVRREAAQLFGQVGWIQHILGQPAKAAEAWGRQAGLLSSLLEEDSANKALRLALADCHRWRANMLAPG